MKKTLLGQLLLRNGLIDDLKLQAALAEQKNAAERLGKILLRRGWVKDTDVTAALAAQFGLSVVELSGQAIDAALGAKISAKFAYRHKIIPLKQEGRVLTIAASDPLDLHTFDDIRLLLGCDVTVTLATEAEILKALRKLYGVGAEMIEQMASGDKAAMADDGADTGVGVLETDEDFAIVRFVDQIIREAYADRATDIHIEPFEDDLLLRYRIDGILHKAPTPVAVKQFQSAIISRIKIMANMDIAEKRLPQDGSIRFRIDGADIDLRVSTLPILHGESVDIRLLPRTQMLLGLEQLGLPPDHLCQLAALIKRPHGIILVTGPTGHGKTTTLYACLNRINSPDKKIITVEDPVEYQLKGINQVSVHSKIGLTFANGLRSILRQDPDVIMVGEIRDQETAAIAIRSSLTGHLVFSTLHTNDAPGAITRLVDMGIEPYLVSSSIEAVIGQRLVRLLCPACRKEDNPGREFLARIGFPAGFSGKIYAQGPGCEACRHTGYKGRTGIYELLRMDDHMKQLVLNKTSAGAIKEEAVTRGMRTLRDDGWSKVQAGRTSIEEIIRVTQEGDGAE
ncbi:MAG: hypothetical protein A2219_06390 [Elusimicrobia bacterium RIFOXYA2_FULL_50_26]|nr:MAG: hypothetical protein A2219_06390 [Elusimicrobia bacterium RIFOXYA2_FULL_50_26]